MRKKTKQSGFSLIELLVGAAIMSVLIIGYMNFMKTRLADAKHNESMYEAETMLNTLKLYFLDKDACMKTLSETVIPTDPNAPVNIYVVKSRTDKTIYDLTNGADPGSSPASVVKLQSIELTNPNEVAPETYGQVELKVTFLRDVNRTRGTENFSRKFQISIGTDSNMKITKCFSSTENAIESAYKLVCEDAGGEYNTVTGVCNFFPIVNGQHSKVQCTNMGGTIFDNGTVKICRVPAGVEVPSGWSPYKNWSTTETVVPTDDDCSTSNKTVHAANISEILAAPEKYQKFPATITDTGSCPTGSHAWSDTSKEECEVTCTETAPCVEATCRTFTVEIESKVTERGYY